MKHLQQKRRGAAPVCKQHSECIMRAAPPHAPILVAYQRTICRALAIAQTAQWALCVSCLSERAGSNLVGGGAVTFIALNYTGFSRSSYSRGGHFIGSCFREMNLMLMQIGLCTILVG